MSQLVSEVRKLGDPRRGAIAFYRPTVNCARCHESESTGRRLGPDLSEKRSVELSHLIESILDPSAKIKHGFETIQVVLDNGQQVIGVLVQETEDALLVDRIEQPDKPLRIPKDQVDKFFPTKLSSMPSRLADLLGDRQQFLDLVSYLDTIAALGAGRAAELKPAGALQLAPLAKYESHVDHAGLIRSLDEAALQRGGETYRLRCASCHGTLQTAGSMPTSLRFATGRFKNGNDPYGMYQTLTHGFGMMNPQRWMVPQQKYEVIHFIREHFLKIHNRPEWFQVTDAYLAALPTGDTLGPKPVTLTPWTRMDYGPSLNNTIEVSNDGSNIAQKGIAIRLDDGPGGVEAGHHWLLYEHDTMRVAGAWSGQFIDWQGIHFNGAHGRHPTIAGKLHFANPTAPGFGRPRQGGLIEADPPDPRLFTDDRVVGRDGKHYGPLPAAWARYLGLYRFGKQTILKYRVGETEFLESPGLAFLAGQPVYTRTLNIGRRDQEMVIQIAHLDGDTRWTPLPSTSSQSTGTRAAQPKGENSLFLWSLPSDTERGSTPTARQGITFTGACFGEIAGGARFEMAESDYSIFTRIQTRHDGTIIAQTQSEPVWIAQGKSLFLRDGKPTFDVGWVGAVSATRRVNDGKTHDVVLTWEAQTSHVRFYIDGKAAGGGKLRPEENLQSPVVRIGFTNADFPDRSFFQGTIEELRFYQRRLMATEIENPDHLSSEKLLGTWNELSNGEIREAGGNKELTAVVAGAPAAAHLQRGLLVGTSLSDAKWITSDGNVRLVIPAGDRVDLVISHCATETIPQAQRIRRQLADVHQVADLTPLTHGGPANYPEKLTTKIRHSHDDGPFSVDVLERPTENPWNCQLRLTGIDFLPGHAAAIVTAWDGSVWRVSGFEEVATRESAEQSVNATLTWQRIASGLFQPLGVKVSDGNIYVTCRDQIVILHDLNGDFEADWYENFNSDHQVTEHFHEFAMGLQTDREGNFYYAKSARHAKTAIVPHHGTLLKVDRSGKQTEIVATGFRAANGVCVNPDGSFLVTDQEGHWNPKNRINWVRPGQFYGNMYGYHGVTDQSDGAMSAPLCWITNTFDRSPSELLWVTSKKWGPLHGALLNFSYGYGQIYVVPYEEVDGQMQGGMCALPIDRLPTGVMRGRFHATDGQLYCCGMFAWAGNQQQPGGLYRIRYTGKSVFLPVGLEASTRGVEIRFSGLLDTATAEDSSNFSVNTWDLKRTANYGSQHYNEQRLRISATKLATDGCTVQLMIPDIKPTWGMEINYSIQTCTGEKLQGRIHNSIHRLRE